MKRPKTHWLLRCHHHHPNNKNTMNRSIIKRQEWCFSNQQMPLPSSSSSCMMESAEANAITNNKILDVSNMEIILRGKQWDRAEDPCAKSVIHLLERNEGLVTWLQPKVYTLFSLCKLFPMQMQR